MQYPQTKKTTHTDSYFNQKVQDPYRWLEDDLSNETNSWITEQNKVTQGFLSKIPFKDTIKKQLTDIWNYPKETVPFNEGNYTYYYKNNGLQNQNILYRKGLNENEEVFLDPNKFSKKGTDALGLVKFTKDGSLVAYSVSEAGSDWRKIYILDTQSKQQVGECLIDIKFSNIAWKGNEGFYYTTYKKPKGSKLSVKTDQHIVFFHKINTSQSKDEIIFGEKTNQKYRYLFTSITECGNYLQITASNTSSYNSLFFKNLTNDSDITPILTSDNTLSYIVSSSKDKFYIFTNHNAPNNKLVVTNINNPDIENWVDLISETKDVLNINTGGSYFFAQYIQDVQSKIFKYDFEGKLISEIELPDIGSVNYFQAKKTDSHIYYFFTNTITPLSIYCYNIEKETTELYWKPNINFNPDLFETKQIFYKTKDGTKIPMTISHKKGLLLNGENQTILYGYGGFNTSLLPSFSNSRAVWMNLGGIFAVANIRGGGEYGKEWHDAGIQFNKQNVFDDFIAGAEYLISKKYTSKEYLAVQGGSNGGLLVGAVMTQRPNLFKVALPAVGVLDMLRYHTFTAGAGWAYDYGTSEQSIEMFENILKYSPLHNIKKGVAYPATLVTTGDHDDRVVPAHSFKFISELQDKHHGENPVLIRIETDAGHGMGKPTNKIIAEQSDILAFTLYNMNIKL